MNWFLDLRYSLRALRSNPGYTLLGIVVLALGIGANAAIFSIVNAVLMRPLPFRTAPRLLAVDSLSKRGDTLVSYPDFQDLRSQNHTLQYLAAFHTDSWALTAPGTNAANLQVAVVSADLFNMLGVKPALGRLFFKSEDGDTSGAMGVLISTPLWRTRFRSDPGIVGRTITLRGLPYTVVGVMPEWFRFPVRNEGFDAWTTFGFSDYLRSPVPWSRERRSRLFDLVGELKPGFTPEQAKEDLAAICAQLAKIYPTSNRYQTIRVQPLMTRVVGAQRRTVLLMAAAVGCVLLIACANLANLSLVRVNSRRRELAICMALGASRTGLLYQVLRESILLACMGGVAGVAVGIAASKLLARLSPVDVPRINETNFDATVLLFAALLSVVSGFAIGAIPAFRASRSDPADALKDNSPKAAGGVSVARTRNALMVCEVAVSLVLLICSGLLVRSLRQLNKLDPGFRAQHVLTAQISFPASRFSNVSFTQAMDSFEARLRTVPGVVATSDAAVVPLAGDSMTTHFELEGKPATKGEETSTRVNIVAPGYFTAMGIPLLAGRDFNADDNEKAGRVVLVNKRFAERFFPDQDPVGKIIRTSIGAYTERTRPQRVIVGVVGSVTQDRIGEKPVPELFFPRGQLAFDFATVVVKTRPNPWSMLPAVEATFRSIDPDIPLDQLHTMDERVSLSLAERRFLSFLLLTFSGLALLLTAVGLYGVIAYSVAQRRREISTRRALGATDNSILALIIGHGVMLTFLGIAIGLAGGVAVSKLLRSLLFEVTPTDPVTLTMAAVAVFVTSLAASFIPSWRAVRIPPAASLRYE